MNFFKKKSTIYYESAIPVYPNIIVPAKNSFPKWHKVLQTFPDNKLLDDGGNIRHTLKQCVPFTDSFLTGYTIVLPFDLVVENKNGFPVFSWRYPEHNMVVIRNKDLMNGVPRPTGYNNFDLAWQTPLSFEVSKKYSVLFTHPLNRYDLPFLTMTVVVDGGWAFHNNANVPFYLKENFEGIIPQGTPIAQLIPFKKEKWISVYSKKILQRSRLNTLAQQSLVSGWYKKTFWTKKEFN